MQHKIESQHIWSLITLNPACDYAFKMCTHSLCSHLSYKEVVCWLVWRKESDVGYIAFIS